MVNNYFAEKDTKYYLDGLMKYEHRRETYVDVQEDYVKNKN